MKRYAYYCTTDFGPPNHASWIGHSEFYAEAHIFRAWWAVGEAVVIATDLSARLVRPVCRDRGTPLKGPLVDFT